MRFASLLMITPFLLVELTYMKVDGFRKPSMQVARMVHMQWPGSEFKKFHVIFLDLERKQELHLNINGNKILPKTHLKPLIVEIGNNL